MTMPKIIAIPDEDGSYGELECPLCRHTSYTEEEFYAHVCREEEDNMY